MVLCSLYANIRRIVPSQFKSLEYRVAANFNGERRIPRITELFGLLGLNPSPPSVPRHHRVFRGAPHERNRSTHGLVANRRHVVSWVMSRALPLVATISRPSLSKA